MKKAFLYTLFLLSLSVQCIYAQSEQVGNFGDNPGNLKMFVHQPIGIEKSTKVPLVIALHGCYQNAEQLAEQSGWSDLADHHQFIVIYPEQQLKNNRSRCFNWFRQDDIDSLSGEVASIHFMIQYAIQNYPIDESRIYIYGVSAGGATTAALLVRFPCIFQAGAILAGGPFKSIDKPTEAIKSMRNPIDRTPQEWGERAGIPLECLPQLIVLHGTKDKVVSLDNSTELIDQWSAIHNIDPVPSRVHSPFNQNQNVSQSIFLNRDNEEVIIFYEVDNLRHQLPIDPGNGQSQGGKASVFSKDMDFHSTYFIAHDFEITK